MQYLVNIAAPAVHRQSDRVDGRWGASGGTFKEKEPAVCDGPSRQRARATPLPFTHRTVEHTAIEQIRFPMAICVEFDPK